MIASLLALVALPASLADFPSFRCPATMNVSEVVAKCDFTGRTALVTGADGGLGSWISRSIHDAGGTVILSCRKAEACDALKASLGGGDRLDTITLDLATFGNVKAAADAVVGKYTKLDVLVNNAAMSTQTNELTDDGWVNTMEVNAFGPAYLTKLLLPLLKAPSPANLVAWTPRVVNVGSASAYGPFMAGIHSLFYDDIPQIVNEWSKNTTIMAGSMFYGVSKFVLTQYTTALAAEEPDVIVLTANPGFSRSDPTVLCPPTMHFRPCPNDYSQGASALVFAALFPGLESSSGMFIDYVTDIKANFTIPYWGQNDPSCGPVALPGWLGHKSGAILWSDADRAELYSAVQGILPPSAQ